jgi:hypothetical protein
MAAAAANNVRVFFMPLLDIVGRMAWPRLDGMAELCRWQVWPYSIQRAGQTLMTSKMSLFEDFGWQSRGDT